MSRDAALIAILDDEEAFRRALSRLLKTNGFEVATFATGAQLVREVRKRKFDCILLDLYMPGMTGIDVLAELRWNAEAPPTIVITAHDDPDLLKRVLALNAFECQCKPISEATLLDAIDRALHR